MPFFAAGAVAFTSFVDEDPLRCEVVYGAYKARSNPIKSKPHVQRPDAPVEEVQTTDPAAEVAPVWDLTPFTDLINWASHLQLFLKTGRADALASATESLSRQLCKKWTTGGRQGPKPQLEALAKALRDFGGDLETIRVRDLLIGDLSKGSAQRLVDAASTHAGDVRRYIPPLGELLDRIVAFARPLQTPTLAGEQGQNAMLALIKPYMNLQRYPEAAVVMRERAVSAHATPAAITPGDGFDDAQREQAKKDLFEANPNAALRQADVRNDIEHGGFRKSPVNAQSLKQNLQKLIDAIDSPVDALKKD